MNHLIRKATLLALGAILVAGAANAGAPSSGQSSKPAIIKVSATNNGGAGPGPNTIDPNGEASYTIRDAVPNPIPGATVVINMSGCPHVQLCANAPSVNCAAKTVTGVTDVNGVIKFRVMGMFGANPNFPGLGYNPPYAGCATVTVTVPGFPTVNYPNVKVSTMDADQGGSPGVTFGDISVMLDDVLPSTNGGNYRERSDHDALPGNDVTFGDISVALDHVFSGGSILSCNPAGCP